MPYRPQDDKWLQSLGETRKRLDERAKKHLHRSAHALPVEDLRKKVDALDPENPAKFLVESMQVGRDLGRVARALGRPFPLQPARATRSADAAQMHYRHAVAKLRKQIKQGGAAAVSEDALFKAVLGGDPPVSRIHQVLHKGALSGLAQARVAQRALLLQASADRTLVKGRGATNAIRTSKTIVTATNGRRPYSYTWAPAAGARGKATEPNQATTRFEVTDLKPGEAFSSHFTCTVRDDAEAEIEVSVEAEFAWVQPLGVTVNTPIVKGRGSSGSALTGPATVTPTGGQAPYSYTWAPAAGARGKATEPNQATTRFEVADLKPGEAFSSHFTCTVRDDAGAEIEVSVEAEFGTATNHEPLEVRVDREAVEGRGAQSVIETDPVTASVKGAGGCPQFTWRRIAGCGAPEDHHAARTRFRLEGLMEGTAEGRFVCEANDGIGQTGQSPEVVATFIRAIPDPEIFSVYVEPTRLDAEGGSASLDTEAVTVWTSGGSGNYAYKWRVETSSPPNGTARAVKDQSETTAFTIDNLAPGEVTEVVFAVVVTDRNAPARRMSSRVTVRFFRHPGGPVAEDHMTTDSMDEAAPTGTVTGAEEDEAADDLAALLRDARFGLGQSEQERLFAAMLAAGIRSPADLVETAERGRRTRPGRKEGVIVRDLLITAMREAGDPAVDDLPDMSAIDSLVKAAKHWNRG